MTMPHSFNDRIDRLEQALKPAACPTCHDRPSRVVMVDPVTDEQLSETMPESGCPTCDRPVFREYVIVADESPEVVCDG